MSICRGLDWMRHRLSGYLLIGVRYGTLGLIQRYRLFRSR
jgi:hypothetical protein